MSGENISKVSALLNTNWEEIENLPDFVAPQNGSYKFVVEKAEVKTDEDNDKISVLVIMSIKETVETDVPMETPYPEGTLCSLRYFGEFGVKLFKKDWSHVQEAIGAASPAEVIDQLAGLEVFGTMRQRKDKDDPTKVFAEAVTIVMA